MKTILDRGLSDDQLLAEVQRLAGSERQATARLVAALAELDARRLYLGQGCSSMFTYCTQVLHLAEHAAYNRIEAARAARRFPVILTLLADGCVHLSAVRLLAPHLTEANHLDVLRKATHKSKREVEQIVARLQPRPDVPASVRKVPSMQAAALAQPGSVESRSAAVSAAPPVERLAPRRALVEPLAPERYRMQFTVSRETNDKLRRVQGPSTSSDPERRSGGDFRSRADDAARRARAEEAGRHRPSARGQTDRYPRASCARGGPAGGLGA